MMKKFLISLIFFIFIFSIAGVCAGENVTLKESDSFNLSSCDAGLNQVSSSDSANYNLYTNDLVKYYKNDSQFEFKVMDGNNSPVSGAKVSLNLNGIIYDKTTDDKGSGSLTINLMPGKYSITTSYNNISKTNIINVLSRFAAKDITSTYGKQTTFSVKLVDKKGLLMANKLMTFKVNNKKYNVYTTSKGVASIKLNLNAGTYTIAYAADGISGKNTYKVKNYCKIAVYKWKSGADVTKNKKIKENVPDSSLVKKIIAAAKKGTPVIKFKGGKGKSVFITAGVHGNELSSQVAAMQLIKYLEENPIKGTVYVMPFMNPKGTANNVRDYAGIHLNKKANVKGTISYNAVKLITKFKCSAYGDFHCTRPGGSPGKDVAMGSYKPTAKSATLAKYIAKKSNVKYLIYKKAGVEYPGAMEDEVNLRHIPAVTCEVITPHGTIAEGSVPKSLSMMKSLLKYAKTI